MGDGWAQDIAQDLLEAVTAKLPSGGALRLGFDDANLSVRENLLLGAYQEILGDMHNLFGDTNAVHVRLGPTGEVMLDSVIKGDTVREVLNYVQFSSDTLVMQLRRDVEAALREGLGVNAGHGLDYRNVMRLTHIQEIVEYNIGHSIIARAVLVGLDQAVREMKALLS